MFDKATIDNLKIAESYVLKNMNLTKESCELFSKLLFNPSFAKEFEKIAEIPDKRLWLEIDATSNEKEDLVWGNFKDKFSNFIKLETINYKDFLQGKKGDKKITTCFFEAVISDVNCLAELVSFIRENDRAIYNTFVKSYFPKNEKKIIEYYGENKIKTDEEKLCIKVKRTSYKKVFNKKEVLNLLKEIKTPLSSLLNQKFFGVRKSNSKFVCFSLNYADWLLCSTAESWESCLSLEGGSYSEGLGSLVGDTNRLMVFISDKTEKTFKGIKSYKMFERGWTFLYKDIFGNKYLYSNRMYPNKLRHFNFEPFLKIFGKDISILNKEPCDLNCKLYTSLYKIPTFFHKPNERRALCYTSSIYEDGHYKELDQFDIKWSYYSTIKGYGGTNETVIYNDGSLEN